MTDKEERDSHAPSSDGDAGPDAAALAQTRVISDEDRTELVAQPVSGSAAETPTSKASDTAGAAEAETRVIDLPEDDSRTSEAPSPPSSDPQGSPGSVPPPPNPSAEGSGALVLGSVLFGEYEIVSVLGVGGMGEVYRARHRRLDEFRAIKVMHAELSKKKGANEFFYREAKALLAVRHPAVVHCHDLLSDEAGRVYLIMEMIEGIPLSTRINDGPLSPDEVAVLGARVSHGLSAAHRKGVIHRDVSPDNIVLPNGRVQEAKLIDFGIAKILQEGDGTIIDGFKGKLSYASPEQLGFFGGKIDGRSDFYSLGLVLIAAAQGRPMSMGTTVMEAVDARRGLASLPDEIPVGLRSAIQPLLALDPDDRPKYVDRLFVVPGGIEGETDPGGYASSGVRSGSPKSVGESKLGLFAGLAVAAAIVVAAGVYLMIGGDASFGARAKSPIAAVQATTAGNAPNSTGTAEKVPLEATTAPEAAVRVEASATGTSAPSIPQTRTARPTVRRVTALDRVKIIGLLRNAKLALTENQLMSPASDNAYDRYRRVLALDSTNQKARDGLYAIAGRYLGFADAALAKGDVAAATGYLDRARQADANHPGISDAEARLVP